MNAGILFHLPALKKAEKTQTGIYKRKAAGQRGLLKPGEYHDSKLISVKLIFKK